MIRKCCNCILSPLRVVDDTVDYELEEYRWQGIFLRLCQFGVVVGALTYYIGYGNYQKEEIGVSATYAKLRGVHYQYSDDINKKINNILDNTHLVIPPKDGSGFFIATRILTNEKQKLGQCESMIPCNNNSDCKMGAKLVEHSNIFTGECVDSQYKSETNVTKVCQVSGWCPIHTSHPSYKTHHIGKEVENFTAFITSHVYFNKWNRKVSNLFNWMTFDYLENCRYHPVTDKNCPVFRIGDIVALASDEDNEANSTIWDNGAVITININWKCDYDKDICELEYNFRRIDNVYPDIYRSEEMTTRGYNFRYSERYFIDDEEHRTLMKVYGIQFLFVVNAEGRKFDLKQTLLNLGSLFGWITSGFGVVILFYFCCCVKEKTEIGECRFEKCRCEESSI